MICIQSPRTQSYLDGELEGAAAAEAERHIETCAECQAQSAATAELSDAIRKQATRHSAPPQLRARIVAALGAPETKQTPRGFWFGAASGAGGMALAASLAVFLLLPPSAQTLAQSVTSAHTSAMMQGRMIQVVSSSHHTVKPWFAGKVTFSPPVADFAKEGFVLAGGRIDEVAGTRAAVVVYRHGAHAIDLFAWPDRGAKLPAPETTLGYHAIFWRSGDLDLAAVSDMDAGEMKKFVALVQRE